MDVFFKLRLKQNCFNEFLELAEELTGFGLLLL